MKFNPKLWQHIHGFFDFSDAYSLMLGKCKDGDWLVEIGSYLGKSACCLGDLIAQSGKKVKVLCVDPWPLYWDADGGVTLDSFSMFRINVIQSGWEQFIFPLRITSANASTLIRNELAGVYIDGDHKYASVVEDIKCWLPKVRVGGILAGHDYSDGWPDVKRAVDDTLGKTISIMGQSWIRNV